MLKKSSSSVKIFYPNYSRQELLELLLKRLPGLEAFLPLKKVVLFGSWAIGKETAFSDIDLLVVYKNPRREEAFKLVKQSFNMQGLEPHVYSEDEAEKLQPTIDQMTKQGIPLFPKMK
jgi:predicted nucleotidyltransferase